MARGSTFTENDLAKLRNALHALDQAEDLFGLALQTRTTPSWELNGSALKTHQATAQDCLESLQHLRKAFANSHGQWTF